MTISTGTCAFLGRTALVVQPPPSSPQDKLSRPHEEVAGGGGVSRGKPLHSHPLQAQARVGKIPRLGGRGSREKVAEFVTVLVVLGGDRLGPLGVFGGGRVLTFQARQGVKTEVKELLQPSDKIAMRVSVVLSSERSPGSRGFRRAGVVSPFMVDGDDENVQMQMVPLPASMSA